MKRYMLFVSVLLVLCLCSCGKDTSSHSFRIDGELPDIGTFSQAEVKEYFSDNVTTEFIPSEDYGTIIPFVGNVKKYTPRSDFDFALGYTFNSYGFCTSDGRIVADVNPRISSVELRFSDEFGLYLVTEQTGFDKCLEFTDTKTWIMPTDGSWKLDLGVNGSVYDVMAGLIFTRNFDKGLSNPAAVYVYDYDGKLVFTFDEKYMFMSASCGRILVMDRENEKYYFLNYQGEKVLGPYDRTYPFNFAGFTYALLSDGLYYIIDTEGNVMSQKGYRNIEMHEDSDKNQCAFSCYNDGRDTSSADILSSRGEYIGTVKNDGEIIENILLFFTPNRGIIYTHNNWFANFKYLDTHERFVSEQMNVCPNAIDMIGEYFFYRNDISGKGVLFDENGKTAVSSDSMDYIADISDDGKTVIYFEEKGVRVYNLESKTLIHDIPYENSYASFLQNDRYIHIVDESGRCGIYDLESDKYVISDKEVAGLYVVEGKTYFYTVSGGISTLFDEEGSVLLRIFTE